MGEIVTSLDALELTERRHNTADGRRLQRSLMLGRVGPARDPQQVADAIAAQLKRQLSDDELQQLPARCVDAEPASSQGTVLHIVGGDCPPCTDRACFLQQPPHSARSD